MFSPRSAVPMGERRSTLSGPSLLQPMIFAELTLASLLTPQAYDAFEQVLMELRKTYMTWQAMDTYWIRHFIISQLSDRQTKLFLPVAKDWVYTIQACVYFCFCFVALALKHVFSTAFSAC